RGDQEKVFGKAGGRSFFSGKSGGFGGNSPPVVIHACCATTGDAAWRLITPVLDRVVYLSELSNSLHSFGFFWQSSERGSVIRVSQTPLSCFSWIYTPPLFSCVRLPSLGCLSFRMKS